MLTLEIKICRQNREREKKYMKNHHKKIAESFN